MKEELWVFNPTKQSVSINLTKKLDVDLLVRLSKHRAKRITKAGFISICIKSFEKKELVSATGLTIEDIKSSGDFHLFHRKGMLEIVSETHVVEVSDEEVELVDEDLEVVEELIEEVVEEVKVEEPSILEEEVDDVKPKSEKKDSSKSRKEKGRGVTLFSKKSKE